MTPLLKDWLNVWATFSFAAAYSGLPQTCKMESFITVVNCHKPLNTVAKCFIFYVCGSPEYISGLIQYHFLQTWFFFLFFFFFFFICLFLRRGKLFFLDNFLSMCIYRLLRNIQNKSVYKINSYKVKKKKSFFIGKLKLLCFMTLVVISKSCYFHNSLPGLCGNLGNLPQLCYTCQFRNYGRECRTLSRISDFALLY